MTRHLRLVRDAKPLPFTRREMECAAAILEARARQGRVVQVSDDLARDIARALRELVTMKGRVA